MEKAGDNLKAGYEKTKETLTGEPEQTETDKLKNRTKGTGENLKDNL